MTTLVSYRQIDSYAPEAGGVVLDTLLLETDGIVVDEITIPTEEDRSGRYSFFRSGRRTQRRVNEAWDESRGTRIYLGEWHTHPEDDPQPSVQDVRNWKRATRLTVYEQDCLLL